MPDGSWQLILFYIVLLFLSAFFSSAESAFAAMNKIRIKNYAEDGNPNAKSAVYISDNFDKAITTILIGTDVVQIGCASIATLFAARLAANHGGDGIYTVYATIITTLAVFFIGEMVPKSYAKSHSDTLVLMYSRLLSFLMKVLTPLSAAAGFFGKIASKLIPDKSEPTVTEDELADIIETIEEEGVLDEGQTDLLQSAMEFAQSTVGDVVTPLDDVVAVEKYSSPESVLETINKSKFSRLPVYVGNKENIVGFIKIRDFLKKYINEGRVFGPAFDWRALILPSECLDSEAPIDEKMQEMSGKKLYLAYVKDKSGKTIGIVTIEDFLEELVGEIWDEDDIVNENFAKLGGNRFEISGKCPIGYAFSEMDLDPPDNIMPSQAIRAWVIAQLGHTPALDEEFTVGNLEIQITEMKDRVIKQLVIKVNYDDEPKLVESEEVK